MFWTTEVEFAAAQLEALAWIDRRLRFNKGPKPKPIARPRSKTEQRLGFGTPMELDALDALIGWESPRSRE